MSELDLGVLARERGWLHRLASTLVQDDEEARDLVQQTVLRALEAPVRGEVSVRAWLDRILRNLWIDGVRRRRAHALEDPASVRSAKPSVEEAAHRWEASTALREAVGHLPREQWEVVVLRFQEELSNSEIAARLGIAPRSVTRRLSEAYDVLRRRLTRRFGRDQWALALVPIGALTRQKSRVVSVSAAAALVGVIVVATVLWVGVLRATDASSGGLEAASLPGSGELQGVGGTVPYTDGELDVPIPSQPARLVTVEQDGASPEPVADLEGDPEEEIDLGPARHLIFDGQPVHGYVARLLTPDLKPFPRDVTDVGEEGFALGSEAGFDVVLRDFTDDPTRWILYSSVLEPDLEFTLGSLEVHLESELDLPLGVPLDEDGNLKWFCAYWTDGLGLEYVCTAEFQNGVATVERVPAGMVEFKLFVTGAGLSWEMGSWPRLGSARVDAGERTVVHL